MKLSIVHELFINNVYYKKAISLFGSPFCSTVIFITPNIVEILYIGLEDATWLRDNFFSYIKKGYNQFIFNLSEVTQIDNSDLGILVAIQK